jgi:hypothetical protein
LKKLLEQVFNQERYRFYAGWNPFDWPGSRDFWEFLRGRDPERLYKMLAVVQRTVQWPDFRHQKDRYLLDLVNHRQLLLKICQSNGAAAKIFADCVVSSQPEFMSFARDLLELHPDNDEIQSALSSAVLEKTGFGSVFDHLTDAEKFVEDQLSTSHVPPHVRRWLQSLSNLIKQRRLEERSFRRIEPFYWE